MIQYKYKLEQYKGINSRFECPKCGKQKVFTRYIDTETGKYLHSTVGRCNRESNCGAHYKPKQYFQDNNTFDGTTMLNTYLIKKTYFCPPHSVSFIPFPFFESSLKLYTQNNFTIFLAKLFGQTITDQLIKKYFIGTSKYWNGATVFWQRNLKKEIRTGKIMLYSPVTGKRIKEPNNHIQWAHKALKLKDYELKQCLFGEHLLNDKTKPIALVESEKTAIIASVYLPQFIWIASGSLNNLNTDNCKVLKDRNVILFPDLNGFSKWESKASELFNNEKYFVSDLLELKATEVEKKKGLDLADYLIKFHHTKFEVPNIIDFPDC